MLNYVIMKHLSAQIMQNTRKIFIHDVIERLDIFLISVDFLLSRILRRLILFLLSMQLCTARSLLPR